MDKLFSLAQGKGPEMAGDLPGVEPEPRASLLMAAEGNPTPQDGSDPSFQAGDWFFLIRAPFRPSSPVFWRSCPAPT